MGQKYETWALCQCQIPFIYLELEQATNSFLLLFLMMG